MPQQPHRQTGTNVLDRMYEASIAKPTASDSGTNSAWAAPCMKNDDTNTARMQSIASSRGNAVSAEPSRTAWASGLPALQVGVNVLDRHRRFVHQNADRQRQAAQRHQVDRLPGDPQRQHRRHQRQRNVQHHDQRAAPVAQEQQNHQPDQHAPSSPSVTTPRPPGHVRRLVELEADFDPLALRQGVLHLRAAPS
jgi:hypothetical protein